MRDPLGLTPQQRREAEERLRTRYEAELTRTVDRASAPPALWQLRRGPGQAFELQTGAFIERLRLEGCFPNTQLVITYRHLLRPGWEFEIAWSVWPDGAAQQPDPSYDATLALDVRESLIDQVGEVNPDLRIPLRRVTCRSALEERRAAEERLRARYEAELTKVVRLRPGKRRLWPVGPDEAQITEARTGAFVEEVRLEGEFPTSQIVIVFRHQLRPADRLAHHFGVWPLGSLNEPEPPYNDVLWINFDEWIAANLRRAPALADDESPTDLSSSDA